MEEEKIHPKNIILFEQQESEKMNGNTSDSQLQKSEYDTREQVNAARPKYYYESSNYTNTNTAEDFESMLSGQYLTGGLQ